MVISGIHPQGRATGNATAQNNALSRDALSVLNLKGRNHDIH